jgi:ribosomal protein S27AE
MKNPRQHRWRQSHPQAVWAHQCLRAALRRGLVKRAPCERCGVGDTEAHHPSYDRPADVRWLCRPCHKTEHRREAGRQG